MMPRTSQSSDTATVIGGFALALELDPGPVFLSIPAQKHAARQHPEDYGRLLPFIGNVVQDPFYLGDDFNNCGKIEFVAKIPALAEHVLVAVVIERDAAGRYHVASFYPVLATAALAAADGADHDAVR